MQRVYDFSEPFEGLSLISSLETVHDPRIDRKKLYPLKEILLVALCGMMTGMEGFRTFEMFGEEKLPFLRRFYPFVNGVPSHDTFARVFSLLCPKQFSRVLEVWVNDLRGKIEGIRHIAVDGKALRGTRIGENKHSAIHLVSAFCSENRLVLGQEKSAHKGYSENDAFFELLERLDVRNATITLDAAGCRAEVAERILDKKANYILCLKGNQGHMHEAVKSHFECLALKNVSEYDEMIDKGHGRIETRRCWTTQDLRCLEGLPPWVGLKTLVCVENERFSKGKTSIETRYFVSSLTGDAMLHNRTIRAHWSIENTLHWVLDVTFSEDKSRVRTKNAPENMAVLRRVCANIYQKIKTARDTIKGLRSRAGLNEEKLFSYISNI